MKMLEIIERLLLKNRTIASTDMTWCMEQLARELPTTLHRFPSGKEFGSWVVPPRWDVRKAELRDGDKVIASYADHPLFLAPYSTSFTGEVGREELLKRTRTSPDNPDAFFYEFRLAMNYQRRLKEWAISLPHKLLERLDKPRYFVDVQVDTGPGEMIVAESTIPGRDKAAFCFLTHLCHPGQANDGLAGVAVGVELMRRIRKEFPSPNHSYQLLVMPETVGSAVFLAADEGRIPSYLGSLFIEMIGIRSPFRLGLTRRGDTYLDRVLRRALEQKGAEFSVIPFRDHWGNDEFVFDSPGVGIPGAEFGRHPFTCYHTSADDLSQTDEARLEEAVEVLLEAVRIMEADYVPRPLQRVPVYLTRYNLYADYVKDRAGYDRNAAILELLWDGKSVFDIAALLGASFADVAAYVGKLRENGLIEADAVTPEYFRRSAYRPLQDSAEPARAG